LWTSEVIKTAYNDTNVVLYLSKSTLKDLDAAANALLTDSSIIMNFAMSTDSNDTTLFGVRFPPVNILRKHSNLEKYNDNI
jgi:hypothetical protein